MTEEIVVIQEVVEVVEVIAEGPQGPMGNQVLNGVGAPSAGLGVNGDFYIDTGALDLYGPKTAGAWGSGIPLGGGGGGLPTGDVTWQPTSFALSSGGALSIEGDTATGDITLTRDDGAGNVITITLLAGGQVAIDTVGPDGSISFVRNDGAGTIGQVAIEEGVTLYHVDGTRRLFASAVADGFLIGTILTSPPFTFTPLFKVGDDDKIGFFGSTTAARQTLHAATATPQDIATALIASTLIADGANPIGGGPIVSGVPASSLQPEDYTLKAWPFPPDVATRIDTDMEDNYSYVSVLRLGEAANLSKIAVHSGSNTAPTTARAALYSISAGVATRQVLANDVRSLFQQFRGRIADLGGTYAHDPTVDELFAVILYPTGGTMPRIARSALDYMDCRYDDGAGALVPWGTHFQFGRIVGSPPASFNLADLLLTDRNFWVAVG